jgi:hypothetical protein
MVVPIFASERADKQILPPLTPHERLNLVAANLVSRVQGAPGKQ